MGCCNTKSSKQNANVDYRKFTKRVLFIGAKQSGKTELIKQAISQSGYNSNVNTWKQSQYIRKSFVINERIPNELKKYTENDNINSVNEKYELICCGYINLHQNINNVFIPETIKNLIIKYFELPIIDSYIMQIERSGSVLNFIELPEICKLYEWTSIYNAFHAALYVVDLSCYNEYFDDKINKMSYSLKLFDLFMNKTGFDKSQSAAIIFYNKKDLFASKIQNEPITVCPELSNYNDGNYSSYDSSISFIRKTFDSIYNDENDNILYSHITCATDRNCIKKTWTDVMHIIIETSLQRSGLLNK